MKRDSTTATIRVAALLLGALALATGAAAESLEAERGAVAAEHRLASQAGLAMLVAGGNAVDAAAAAALATGVVNPSSSGLGGGGFAVVWKADERRAYAIDFRETAPRRARADMYLDASGKVDAEASKTGAAAVGVPGEVRGLASALARHGTMTFAAVAEPAIRLARDGFAIEAHLAKTIARDQRRLAADPSLAKVFLREDGSPKTQGERLVRSDLAATLERLAAAGPDDFYTGEIARDVAAATAGSPFGLDGEDLADYQAIEREPLLLRYRGATIATIGPPSSGGALVGTALAVLGGYDLEALGFASATYLHLLAETLKATFADRAYYYGDPAFIRVPLERLLSPAHAAEIRSKLRAASASPSSSFAPLLDAGSDAGTSHISVVDAEGNAVALTTSVNTGFGSALGVAGRGFVLNNTMDDFAAAPGVANAFGAVGSDANAIAPGKRPLSSMTPLILVEDGRVRLVAGASGGPLIITSTLQTLLAVTDFRLSATDAVAAPRIHHQWLPEFLMVESAVAEATTASLARLGHEVRALPPIASVQAIEVSQREGRRRLLAVSDSRKGGVPAGY